MYKNLEVNFYTSGVGTFLNSILEISESGLG